MKRINSDIIKGNDALCLCKKLLIDQAESIYTEVYLTPIAKEDVNKSFTRFKGKLVFWFNSKDTSTHVLQMELK